MENKMTEEQGKKIKSLTKEIDELQDQVREREYEIERIIVESAGNFEGSYIEFYDEDEYVFMKVERQVVRYSGRLICLYGPAIRLPDTPLREQDEDDDGIDLGSYDESDYIQFGPQVLQGSSVSTIRKITKKDMGVVLDYYINTMKKNLI